MIFRKTKEYYQQKISIDKSRNKSTAYKVQLYNNAKVDDLVRNYSEGNVINKPAPSLLWAELSILNKSNVYKNYNRIINSKYTSNENLQKLLIKNKANKDLNRIVEHEVNRIVKNLDYVEQVMKGYNITYEQYEEFKAKQKNRSMANRKEILEQVAVKNKEILVSEGLNIPSNVFTYRNLEASAENLLRQSQMQSKHEEINAINDNYLAEGKDKIYTGKEWIWTGAGATTRHASNDHQIRQVNEPFIIVNDETLEIDELMYPSDPAGSPSNTFICYCEVEYLT